MIQLRNLTKDKRNIVIALLSALFFIKIPQLDFRFIIWMISGFSLSGILDYLVKRIFLKKNVLPKSAFITGLIVAGVLDYRQPIFVLFIFLFLAIVSKYVLRFRKKHIFNPANFSLFVATLFKLHLAWNIESNIYLIIIVGLFLASSFKKFFHLFGFLLIFSGLFWIEGFNPFNLVSWFFLFIMLIEPKTSGGGLLRGSIFGGIAGLACFLIFKFWPGMDIFVTALAIANLFNPLLETKINRS